MTNNNSGQHPVKTANEIIKIKYPFYSPLIGKDVELDGESVIELMEEYASQFREGQQSAGVWVKASERLPEENVRRNPIVKWEQDFGNTRDGKCSYLLFSTLKYYAENPDKYFNVYWLDESPVPSKEQGEEKVLDEFGHHNVWKFCPGCGKEWDKEEGDDQFGCSSCGYTKSANEDKRRMELEKENARLKAENEGHKEIARARGEAIVELQNEIERLKGTIKEILPYCAFK